MRMRPAGSAQLGLGAGRQRAAIALMMSLTVDPDVARNTAGRYFNTRLSAPNVWELDVDPGWVTMSKSKACMAGQADQAAGGPRMSEASGSLRRDLALKGASGAPACRSRCCLVF